MLARSFTGSSDEECWTVADPELIRAVRVSQVIARCCYVLRDQTPLAENFNMSTVVQDVGVFLSHTWNTPPLLKAVALLFTFNIRLALAAAILCHVLIHVLSVVGLVDILGLMNIFLPAYIPEGTRVIEVHFPATYVVPCLVLAVTFLLGQNVGRVLDGCASFKGKLTFDPYMFLDKCCIHQTDQAKKQAGIKQLAAFIKQSQCMLVLWHKTYFHRVWCIFELAAFVRIKGDSRNIIFVPLKLPLLSAFLFVFHCFASTAFCLAAPQTLFNKPFVLWFAEFTPDALHFPVTFAWVFMFLFGLYLAPACLLLVFIRSHVRDYEELCQQLSSFSLEFAECSVESDRHFVENSIVRWFGSVAKFEKYVQTDLAEHVSNLVLHTSLIPYRYVLVGSIPHFFLFFDAATMAAYEGEFKQACALALGCVALTFVGDPIAINLSLRLVVAVLDVPGHSFFRRRIVGPALVSLIMAFVNALSGLMLVTCLPLWMNAAVLCCGLYYTFRLYTVPARASRGPCGVEVPVTMQMQSACFLEVPAS